MARKPLSLSAYLAYARGRQGPPSQDGAPPPARPDGPLIWLHAQSAEAARALTALANRMQQQRGGGGVLLTGPATVLAAAPPCPGLISQPLPEDTPLEIQRFAAHWHPDLLLWTGQELRPALLHRMQESGTRMVLIDAQDQPWITPSPIWVPDASGATLALFDRIFVPSDGALRQLRRLGLPDGQLTRAGPLSESAPPLDCDPRQHEDMSAILTSRPVWLAARARANEADAILRAHARATRLAHRLLLLLIPATREDGAAIAEQLRASDMRVHFWEEMGQPDENTQVLLTEDASELGLWYRLAPVTFMGGSLMPGHGGEDPLEAAAHGTALLYGPNVGRHLGSYKRLVDAGAARIIRDFDSLSSAVTQLMAPDQAAAMAHAGWDVVSQGADLTDDLIAFASDWLDESEHA